MGMARRRRRRRSRREQGRATSYTPGRMSQLGASGSGSDVEPAVWSSLSPCLLAVAVVRGSEIAARDPTSEGKAGVADDVQQNRMWDSSRGRREEEGQEEQEEEEEEDTASALLFVHGRGPGQPAEQSSAEQSQREGLPATLDYVSLLELLELSRTMTTCGLGRPPNSLSKSPSNLVGTAASAHRRPPPPSVLWLHLRPLRSTLWMGHKKALPDLSLGAMIALAPTGGDLAWAQPVSASWSSPGARAHTYSWDGSSSSPLAGNLRPPGWSLGGFGGGSNHGGGPTDRTSAAAKVLTYDGKSTVEAAEAHRR
ncbi:hypothetical protein PCL_00304 [Purpureocillium lilacinum]|uniref:Uncharacterized protein n=1 Tax=Purpureocillium lilacinum TaxID=33203 RepID=A0A2U3E6M3_PURLI|nr:hypothetical protein PCL_00304 [Purpureocillium lilacinum]